MKTPVIAVVGATGAVGEEILLCLDQLKVPHQEIKLLASARSAGKTLPFQGKDLVIQELTEDAFASVDIALFSVGSDIVKTFAPLAAETGAIVIDNSSAYRMDDDVPLVIPEINGEDAKNVPRNIIANPNCTTIVTLMALNPMHQAFGGCETLIASSYQAVSGSGAQGIAELEDQVKAYAEDQPIEVNLYPRQIAFNVIPQVEPITENGYTKEEMKMQNETRKILHAPNIRASATCVRVPVLRSHAVSATAQFASKPDVEAARQAIKEAPGIELVDDRDVPSYPTPLDVANGDDCMVGRIREDLALDNSLAFWVVGDQVRKGAALNAVQIAALLID
ncbi:MAG: aspartate-semialdehyde dehydrogenase [Verrucomicrobiales bacterium]|jgi:aspartate-semialdehyde dehydrogenase|nr:aspartate-semialdehyde dehydrogenase [Verrucomicrobiales bacterium]MDB2347880.1 aspartate-semialdehyde dehydrogenase [Verrucomicrobiales bacterium]MDB4526893.1 aspartate-semialdehyde dehydrogenase [bacterium]MDB4627176.1 aspartate-semialdehyde dehydrogenase [bacterium]MDF1787666.1 aspartate-semialdehyde dehydrogenase [Verrucomicrobiales bacterium]